VVATQTKYYARRALMNRLVDGNGAGRMRRRGTRLPRMVTLREKGGGATAGARQCARRTESCRAEPASRPRINRWRWPTMRVGDGRIGEFDSRAWEAHFVRDGLMW